MGENLQDQMNNGFTATNSNSSLTSRTAVVYPTVDDVFGNEANTIAQQIKASLPGYAYQTAKTLNGTMDAEVLLKLYEVQHDIIFKSKAPIAEVLITPNGPTISGEFWSLLPFARGNVHIKSAKPNEPLAINPNYFQFDWDVRVQVASAKFLRKIWQTAPFNSLVVNETTPGLIVPQDATDDQWKAFLIDTCKY